MAKKLKEEKKVKKNKGGRPKKIIDYEKLDRLCYIQCTGEEIAAILGMSYELLNNKLKREKKKGFLDYFGEKSAGGKMSLRRRQFAMAETNPTMSIWLGKQYLKQVDKQELNHRSSDGSMAPTVIRIVAPKMSTNE